MRLAEHASTVINVLVDQQHLVGSVRLANADPLDAVAAWIAICSLNLNLM
jgi:hypothetical protein